VPRTIELYHFSYYDPIRRRRFLARYVLEAPAIRCRYPDGELVGKPERRQVPDDRYALSAAHLARGWNEGR
jgi:hypothetical protein